MKSDNVEKIILNKDEIYDAKYDEIKTDVFDEISNNSEGVPDHTGKRTRLFLVGWLAWNLREIGINQKNLLGALRKFTQFV